MNNTTEYIDAMAAARTKAAEYGDKELALISRVTAQILSRNHYRQQPLDVNISRQFFDEYLNELDPGRIYFSLEDVTELSKDRDHLCEQLQAGDSSFAFKAYDLFRKRLEEYRTFAEKRLNEPFDFTLDESYMPDRSKEPRTKDMSERMEMTGDQFTALLVVRGDGHVGGAFGGDGDGVDVGIDGADRGDDGVVRNGAEDHDVVVGGGVEERLPRLAVLGRDAAEFVARQFPDQLLAHPAQIGVIAEIEQHAGPARLAVNEITVPVERFGHPRPGGGADQRRLVDDPVEGHHADFQFACDFPEVDLQISLTRFHDNPFRFRITYCALWRFQLIKRLENY